MSVPPAGLRETAIESALSFHLLKSYPGQLLSRDATDEYVITRLRDKWAAYSPMIQCHRHEE